MKKYLFYLLYVFTISQAAPCFIQGVVIDIYTKKPIQKAKIFNEKMRASAVQDTVLNLPILLNQNNSLKITALEYQIKMMDFFVKDCPEKKIVFELKPEVQEIEEISIEGCDPKTMLYKMIHAPSLLNTGVGNYVETKRYDPTELSGTTIQQIASPISSIFALANKKSRQRRRIEKYRQEINQQKDSIFVENPTIEK